MTMQLTEATLKTFLAFANDAGNWSGNPWVSNSNVTCTKAMRGNLTDLVQKGLIVIKQDAEYGGYIVFTEAGVKLAKENGCDMSDYE